MFWSITQRIKLNFFIHGKVLKSQELMNNNKP